MAGARSCRRLSDRGYRFVEVRDCRSPEIGGFVSRPTTAHRQDRILPDDGSNHQPIGRDSSPPEQDAAGTMLSLGGRGRICDARPDGPRCPHNGLSPHAVGAAMYYI